MLMHVFHDNSLIYSGMSPFDVPEDSYIYWPTLKEWSIRYHRIDTRPLPTKHVPKAIKVLCLLHNIPL